MPKDPQKLNERNRELLEKYIQLSKEGESHEDSLIILAKQFHIAKRTINGWLSGEYERRKQKKSVLKEKKYPKPEIYKPSKEELIEAMEKLSQYFSDKSILFSPDYPELKIQGKRQKK